jgi:hypothetical protein
MEQEEQVELLVHQLPQAHQVQAELMGQEELLVVVVQVLQVARQELTVHQGLAELQVPLERVERQPQVVLMDLEELVDLQELVLQVEQAVRLLQQVHLEQAALQEHQDLQV